MKLTTVLSTVMLLLVPGAIVPAYAQEHEQEKQPEQKQQEAKPAQHQQEAKPAKPTQQAHHPQQAKPAQEPQRAASQQKAKPAKQTQQAQHQQASRGAQPAAGHGSISEAKFHASFGSGHTFHVNRSQFANGRGRFQYGGFWFNVLNPWPAGWLYTDSVYVDYLNGGYFLCDPVHPGVYISINIG
jgi:glucan-binding YG repeat protein